MVVLGGIAVVARGGLVWGVGDTLKEACDEAQSVLGEAAQIDMEELPEYHVADEEELCWGRCTETFVSAFRDPYRNHDLVYECDPDFDPSLLYMPEEVE